MLQQLSNLLGAKHVLTGDAVSERTTSFWDPSPMQGLALVRPGSTQEVSEALRICNNARQPVVVIGGNTGGVQGQHPLGNEVIISMERMNLIEEVDELNASVTVQAGCILEDVQRAVAEYGLLYPLDLGGRGSCTVGGNVSSNAGGINVIRHGMMRNVTLGLEAVLADGTVLSSMNRMIKNNTGYDLKQLFIGSEGTLGVVTRAVVKLEEAPISVNTAMLALESFEMVTELLRHLRRTVGGVLSAYEFMDNDYYRAVTGPDGNRAPISREHACYVVTETRGTHPEHDEAIFQTALMEAIESGIVLDAVIAGSERERKEFWTVRENFEPLLLEKPYFIYDISLPIGAMEDYMGHVKNEIRNRWPDSFCGSLAHVGDNNLHFFIAPRCDDRHAHTNATEIVYKPLAGLQGSISAEHGIGFEKKKYLKLSRTQKEIDTMRLLKRTLDPNNILARGRIFDLV